jgi:UDP-N-acetylglucosamine acyltransferase
MIHPTAIVSSRAEIDPSVNVGPYAVIGDDVILKEGVEVGSMSSSRAPLSLETELGSFLLRALE